jgi:hypothetical protein
MSDNIGSKMNKGGRKPKFDEPMKVYYIRGPVRFEKQIQELVKNKIDELLADEQKNTDI